MPVEFACQEENARAPFARRGVRRWEAAGGGGCISRTETDDQMIAYCVTFCAQVTRASVHVFRKKKRYHSQNKDGR